MNYQFVIYAGPENIAKFETNDEMFFNTIVDSLGNDWAAHVRIRMTIDGHPPATYKMEEIP